MPRGNNRLATAVASPWCGRWRKRSFGNANRGQSESKVFGNSPDATCDQHRPLAWKQDFRVCRSAAENGPRRPHCRCGRPGSRRWRRVLLAEAVVATPDGGTVCDRDIGKQCEGPLHVKNGVGGWRDDPCKKWPNGAGRFEAIQEGPAPQEIGGYLVQFRSTSIPRGGQHQSQVEGFIHLMKADVAASRTSSSPRWICNPHEFPISLATEYRWFFGLGDWPKTEPKRDQARPRIGTPHFTAVASWRAKVTNSSTAPRSNGSAAFASRSPRPFPGSGEIPPRRIHDINFAFNGRSSLRR